MKKSRINEQIVITRPSTTLIQSQFVVYPASLFQRSKQILQSQWLKPHSEAMYLHLFHQMVRQHSKSTVTYINPHSASASKLFSKYFDMPNIAKIIKPCIKNCLSQDKFHPNLCRKIALNVERIRKHQQKSKNKAKHKIQQLKEQDPMRTSLTPSFKSKKQKLRFNFKENNPLQHNRNVLGIIQKKSPLKEQQNYGLEAIQKTKTLLNHKKRLSNLTNYHNLDFIPKEQIDNFPPSSTKMSNYYKIGLTSQHLTKQTSPQKSLKSSRKSSMKKQTVLKKISSQKSIGKKEIKGFKK